MSDFSFSTVTIPFVNFKSETREFTFRVPEKANLSQFQINELCRNHGFKRISVGGKVPKSYVDIEPWDEVVKFCSSWDSNLFGHIEQALRVPYRPNKYLDFGKVILRQEANSLGGCFHFWSDFQVALKGDYLTFKGTARSLNLAKQRSRQKRQLDNIEKYLKLFYLGRAYDTNPLLCAYSGKPLITKDEYRNIYDIDCDLHHILNYLGQSCFKNQFYEPSTILRTKYVADSDLFELMTTIPLLSYQHKKIHKTFTQGHDIDFFKQLWKQPLWNETRRPPSFIFESKENYEKVCDWLEQEDGRVNFSKNYPYSKFLQHLTYRNEMEREKCESDITDFFESIA